MWRGPVGDGANLTLTGRDIDFVYFKICRKVTKKLCNHNDAVNLYGRAFGTFTMYNAQSIAAHDIER